MEKLIDYSKDLKEIALDDAIDSWECCCPECRKTVAIPAGKGIAPELIGWTKTKEGKFQVVSKCPACGCVFRFYAGTFDQEFPKAFNLELNRLLWGGNIVLADKKG